MYDLKEIEAKAKDAIKELRIPKRLQQDAVQEFWLATLQNEDAFNHLKLWKNKELSYEYQHEPMEEIREKPDHGSDLARIYEKGANRPKQAKTRKNGFAGSH